MRSRHPLLRPRSAWAVLLLLTTVTLVIGSGPAASPARAGDQTFVIDFSPTDGAVWHKSTYDRRLRDYGTMAPISEQVTEIEAVQRYESQPDGSWHVVQTVESVEMRMNEEPMNNPMLPILQTQPIEIVLNSGGQAVDALGFRELMRRYERELDPQLLQRAREQMSARSMAEGEIEKWNGALEGLRGLELTVGEKIGVLDVADMQGQPLKTEGVLTVGEWTELDGEPGVTVTYEFDALGEVFAAHEDEITRTISRRGDDPIQERNHQLDMRGKIVTVVQPSTGQLLFQSVEQTTLVPVAQPELDHARIETEIRNRWRPVEGGEDS
ncbi:MAG TPA: hypothetical protein VKA86_06525 [Candidatus Krumholzibacteria bacterium]|nr:hypothetical protein [Candidatus Krumholzibacteria bacterium]